MEHWIKIDIRQNWATAFRQAPPLVGISAKNKQLFSAVKPGDILWFYSIKPVRGIIGFGRIAKKYKDEDKPVFMPELRMRKVLFPFRFELEDIRIFEAASWVDNHIDIGDFRLTWTEEFQPLLDNHSKKLITRAERRFCLEFKEYINAKN
ncbi:MAG: hypothetical protein ABIH68_04640 [bacterium]